jgi:asparagine synthase (glutamine-hydrolysing)
MCGLGGIIGGDLRANERETAALRMRDALRHRGPDGVSHFTSASGTATLVHSRLAIQDPRPVGAQPMTRGSLTITFNGEVYNFRELRCRLIEDGEIFATNTDTEVVLTLFARLGLEALRLLRGMYAFAIWDERDRTCFFARDPFGIKPLYFAPLASGALIFASELRALLAGGLVPRRMNGLALREFLAAGSVPEPLTLIAGVRCLEAGHWLHWADGRSKAGTHFAIGFPDHDQSPQDASSLVRSALQDSMQYHLVSDVPVGLLLSGGVDSTALLALAHPGGPGKLATFSIGLEDTRMDEADAARSIARHFGAEHHEMLLTRELARHWIDDFLSALDQPTIDGFNTFCACKLASDYGFRVVLSGIGADELFGGYPSFRQIPRLLTAGKILRPMRGLTTFPARGANRLSAGPRARRVLDYLAGPPSLGRAYAAVRGISTAVETKRILLALFPGSRDFPEAGPDHLPLTENVADAISHLELTRYLRNQLLRDADVMSMAHGVELRVPFLDVPFFETLQSVPARTRFAAGKRLLREAVSELPGPLLSPRKKGFSLPFDSWLAHGFDFAGSLPNIPGVAFSTWSRQWSLRVLTHWMHRHHVTGISW